MTIPVERTRAVTATREFLYALLDPKKTPRVPRAIRQWASRCARHYPGSYDLHEAARLCPKSFGPIDGN
jgi:hypothetical protein